MHYRYVLPLRTTATYYRYALPPRCTTHPHYALHTLIMHYTPSLCTTHPHYALHTLIVHYTPSLCTTHPHCALDTPTFFERDRPANPEQAAERYSTTVSVLVTGYWFPHHHYRTSTQTPLSHYLLPINRRILVNRMQYTHRLVRRL